MKGELCWVFDFFFGGGGVLLPISLPVTPAWTRSGRRRAIAEQ